MNIGYDASCVLHDRTSRGNAQRMIVEALAHCHPHHRYMLYTPCLPQETRHLRLLLNAPCVHIKTPHGLTLLKNRWRTGSGILHACHRHYVKVFHGIDGVLPRGIEKSGMRSVVTVAQVDQDTAQACRVADCIVACSESVKRELERTCGVEPDKVRVVHPGCEPAYAAAVTSSEIERVTGLYDLPPRYVLSIGALDERHNLELTVRALAQVPSADLHIVIVGHSTPYYKKVKTLAAECGVEKRLYRLPQVHASDLPAIYHQAVATVCPSRHDALGISLIESLSCGTPVIGATGSGMEEAGGPGGLYVDAHSPSQLAQAIAAIAGDAGRRQAMAVAGARHIEQFAMQPVADAMMTIYQELEAKP